MRKDREKSCFRRIYEKCVLTRELFLKVITRSGSPHNIEYLVNKSRFTGLVEISADMDLAIGRGYIDQVQWTQKQGSWAFEVFIYVRYARNCLDSVSVTHAGLAYSGDRYYEDGLDHSEYVYTARWTGSTGFKTTNYYVEESHFRRGSSSGEDGLMIQIKIRKWGFLFFPISEGYVTIKDWHWIDANSDDTWDTGWINGLKVWYSLDIIST